MTSPSSKVVRKLRKIGLFATLILGILLLSACGENSSDESDNDTAITRVLYDSPVNGVTYECDGQSRKTANGGEFLCLDAPVKFSIGDLLLGEVFDFNVDNRVFIQDIIGVGRESFDDENVVKLSRLLLTLDDDGVVSDEITIDEQVAARFTAGESLEDELEDLADAAGVVLVSRPFAISHLKRSLRGGSDSTEYTIRIQVDDPDPAVLLIAEDVSLDLIGAEIYTDTQLHGNKLTVDNEYKTITFFLKNPPEENQDIKILAKANGYLDTGATILLNEDQTHYQVQLKMVKAGDGIVSTGVFASQLDLEGKVNSNGEVLEEISVQSKSAVIVPGTTVTIPEGALLTDADGNPVQGASLRVTNFDPYQPDALAAYPGGLNVMAEVDGFSIGGDPQSGEQEINFKSAGFVAINIEDEAGNKAKNFSLDIEVAMQFKIGTMDANGNVVQIGDEVPIWSYDEDTGQWSYEKVGITQDLDLADGLYDVVYSINHLTYFNLDWHVANKCETPEFEFLGPDGDRVRIDTIKPRLLVYTNPVIDSVLNTNGYVPLDDLPFEQRYSIGFANAPGGFPGKMEAYSLDGDTLLGELDFDDICEAPDGSKFVVELGIEPIDSYAEAKDRLEVLRNAPDKVAGINLARVLLGKILGMAAQFLANGDDRGPELFDETKDVYFMYHEAFFENVDDVFEERLTSLGFIDTDLGGFGGYGCLKGDLSAYLDLIIEIFAEYESLGGTELYGISDMSLQFLEEAAKDFIAYEPTTLAYSAEGVSGFVECGIDLFGRLQFLGYEGSEGLDYEIIHHFETVARLSVASMKLDVEDELANGAPAIGDAPPTAAGIISFSTAETFSFIIEDALSVATDLQASGSFSEAGIAEINAAKDFLQELFDDGKVGVGAG